MPPVTWAHFSGDGKYTIKQDGKVVGYSYRKPYGFNTYSLSKDDGHLVSHTFASLNVVLDWFEEGGDE